MSGQSTGIILSGTYAGGGLVAEFGLLPPSFLPLGNRRLYHWQVEQLKPLVDHIVLTLPAGFELDEADRKWLDLKNVHVAYQPDGLSLGEAIARSLDDIAGVAP